MRVEKVDAEKLVDDFEKACYHMFTADLDLDIFAHREAMGILVSKYENRKSRLLNYIHMLERRELVQ